MAILENNGNASNGNDSNDTTGRAEYNDVVSRPGKFENCNPWVPYYWDAYLNGMADDDNGDVLTFEVNDQDRLIFPELADVANVYLSESSDGFVSEVAGPADDDQDDDEDGPGADDSDEDPDDYTVYPDDVPTTSGVQPSPVGSEGLATVIIPSACLDLAGAWHGDTGCMLYALTSTGNLTLGTLRPYSDDAGRPMTDREWHVHIWGQLEADVRHAAQLAEKSSHLDAIALRRFETFCEATSAELRAVYGLEDSDVV